VPLAIEQDLVWRPATPSNPPRPIVSHGGPFTGREPSLRDFFGRIRPIATRALASTSRTQWPLITLNLDFKDSHPAHFAAVWRVLAEFDGWLTTAPRVADATSVQPLTRAGALTGDERVAFHGRPRWGRVFGAVPEVERRQLSALVNHRAR
jgi:hypothetical protein